MYLHETTTDARLPHHHDNRDENDVHHETHLLVNCVSFLLLQADCMKVLE